MRIAALVLAAGMSTRMGTTNKLLTSVDGVPMVVRVVDSVVASHVDEVVVVIGYQADAVKAVLEPHPVHFEYNGEYRSGLSTSLRRGLQALSENISGVLICLGDMPLIKPSVLNHLISAFDQTGGNKIYVPTFRGRRGNPVLIGRSFFSEMSEITGDTGARYLVGSHPQQVCEVEVGSAAVWVDVDSPEDLRLLGGRICP